MNYGLTFPRKIFLLSVLIVAVVSVPFVVWGDAFVRPLLESQAQRTGLLGLVAIALLMADSVAPVPATLVIMFLAAKAGWLVGLTGGTVGLSLGVLAAAWVGRTAVGRLVPRFFPDSELSRLRGGVQRNLAFTLACWRSVPVLAEASVMLAAAAGVPVSRIFRVTLLPNLVISAVYSLAADDSFATACVAFLAVFAFSMALWWLGRQEPDIVSTANGKVGDDSH
jgi:hypothetical protein